SSDSRSLSLLLESNRRKHACENKAGLFDRNASLDFPYHQISVDGHDGLSWISISIRSSNVVAGFSPRLRRLMDTVFRKRTRAEARDYITACSFPIIARNPVRHFRVELTDSD